MSVMRANRQGSGNITALKAKPVEKHTLITNVSFAQFVQEQPVSKLWCYAVLLTENGHGFFEKPTQTIRGFGSDAAYPIFSTWLGDNAFPYTVNQAESADMFIGHDNKMRPMSSGAVFHFGDGTRLYLNVEDNACPLDIVSFQEGTEIDVVWNTLQKKVAQYWQAPNMPVLSYSPARLVRMALGG